ncbi:MarR family winged helix-turn-helix transcriptional regulator [Microbacterium lushaniae]|uniref:Winged helix-turn-helix transcriptional regulator n=1 Tax=Microbacterium lushaniae TaxID=2614639 RepID=A0A5J6L8Q2_9MICO|nr:MarR family winged helix-turn-helix transcriptional regulator [Microbacterium lushaniae]QEW04692.1 winged helix-turn-helix transcriptional regulator [Microbacterium lushaniae]
MPAALRPDDLAKGLAQIFVAIGPVYRKAARVVESSEAASGMSVGVRAVLDHLYREGERTVPQIAESLELSRQYIQRMVNDASGDDFVELVANPAHRRSSLVRLTGDGRTAIERVVAREHEVMARIGGTLTATDIEATLRVLRHMHTALDELTG